MTLSEDDGYVTAEVCDAELDVSVTRVVTVGERRGTDEVSCGSRVVGVEVGALVTGAVVAEFWKLVVSVAVLDLSKTAVVWN